MKLKALIIESTRHYRSVLDKILSDIGVECDIFENAEEALKSTTKAEYAFILVSRYLDDTTGELFLHRYREKYVLGEALTIMLTSGEVSSV
ncbi:MAG: response regulator, partial [Gammaproteobacteria bacterium]|nr:response regulator [Gammaproteobacteria bacterium]